MSKNKKKTSKPKTKYTGEEGEYLTIDDRGEYFQIGWVYPDDDDDLGAHLGECNFTEAQARMSQAEYETWIAEQTVKPFSNGETRAGEAFQFDTKAKAAAALKAANEALLRGDGKPWPEWALKAKEAGWTPPKGWKP